MKIALIVLGILALVALASGINYLLQRRRQQKIQDTGLVLYAAVLRASKVGGILKYLDLHKIDLSLQEPNQPPREVSLRSRTPPGQRITPGMRLIVVVDPKKPANVYPATPEASKRVTLTGSKQEQKLMKAQMKNPRRFHQRTQTGYMPPIDKIR